MITDIVNRLLHVFVSVVQHVCGTIRFRLKTIFLGVKAGAVACYGSIDLYRSPGSSISFGENVIVMSSSFRCTSAALFAKTKVSTLSRSARILVGNNVHLNGTSIVARSKEIRIGDGTLIAPNVSIVDSDFHALWAPDGRAAAPNFEGDADVNIGQNVWIGMRAIILKGVSIGDNAVIGAGSVVTGDIPANTLAAGNPARVIKTLSKEK